MSEFDQFVADPSTSPAGGSNEFDQFVNPNGDEGAGTSNEFDQFIKSPTAAPATAVAVAKQPVVVAQAKTSNPAAYLEQQIMNGLGVGPRGQQIVGTAEQAAGEVAKEFIPSSVGGVVQMLTPLASAPQQIYRGYHEIRDLMTDMTPEEIIARNIPEAQEAIDTAKTPAWSEARFKEGFRTAASMLMAHALTGQIIRGGVEPNASQITSPESVPVPEVRQGMGGEAPLQQQGEAPSPQEQAQAQEVAPEPIGIEAAIAEIQQRNAPAPTKLEEDVAKFQQQQGGEVLSESQQNQPTPAETAQASDKTTSEQAQPDNNQEQAPVGPEPPVPPEGTGGPVGANVKGFEKIYGEGEIPAGRTLSPEDEFAAARARSESGRANPYGFVDRARTGAITPHEMADLVYEHDRLIHEAAAAEGTPQYDELYNRARDFAENVVKPAENAWHQKGMAMQIKAPLDYTRLTGFREALRNRMGREMTPQEEPAFQKIANNVAQSRNEAYSAASETANRVQKYFKRVKDISFEDASKQMHDSIAELVKDCNL